jgi:hypothetical protein
MCVCKGMDKEKKNRSLQANFMTQLKIHAHTHTHTHTHIHTQALTSSLQSRGLSLPSSLLLADNSDPSSLDAAFSQTHLLLNCTGPYRFLGEDVCMCVCVCVCVCVFVCIVRRVDVGAWLFFRSFFLSHIFFERFYRHIHTHTHTYTPTGRQILPAHPHRLYRSLWRAGIYGQMSFALSRGSPCEECMCVCMCIYIYMYFVSLTYTHTQSHTHTHTQILLLSAYASHTHTHTHTHTPTHTEILILSACASLCLSLSLSLSLTHPPTHPPTHRSSSSPPVPSILCPPT